MQSFLRPLAVVCLALLVPVLPFLSFGNWLEARVDDWLDPPPSPGVVALLSVAVLASDILLPVPSSFVSTFAGAQLGIAAATAVTWLGMTLGAVLGFLIAKTWGRAIAERLSSLDDLDRMDGLARRHGPWLVVLTRALPVLAEAAVLLVGMTQLSWRSFLPAATLSNLGIAVVYSVLGHLARSQGQLALALAGSIAVPLVAATIARRLLR